MLDVATTFFSAKNAVENFSLNPRDRVCLGVGTTHGVARVQVVGKLSKS